MARQSDVAPDEHAGVLKVAIDAPLYRLFDYLPPSDAAFPPRVGCRVRVPFGRGSRVGVVWATATESHLEPGRLKRAADVLDEVPVFGADDLYLLQFASEYYRHAPGEVLATALPLALRQGRDAVASDTYWWATEAGAAACDASLARRAPRQHALLSALMANPGGTPAGTLNERVPGWRRVASALVERGWLDSEIRRLQPIPQPAQAPGGPPPVQLNEAQQQAFDAIRDGMDEFSVSLLDGVTGSGKTEVYLRLIDRCLAVGRQALVLVPEIGLTPQLTDRFRRRLGLEPVMMHSGLTDAQRLAGWQAARSGAARVIVGTRSAVFTPLPDAGLIIVDEEHDASLKQQEGFRYHARDLAIVRAQKLGVPIVLGSATPSLETLHNALSGRYRHLRLERRAGSARPPSVRVVDMNRFRAADGLSAPVLDAIRSHVEADQQVLVYINRRGFAPTVICADCGDIVDCPRCDAHMTLHAAAARLRCHHCGADMPLPAQCPHCEGPLKPLGEGTQRIEEALQHAFPDWPVRRIDSDTTQKRGSMTEALRQARDGTTRILVGTQMLAKGHHFPALTLVVVINADQGFFGSDFRAAERLAQSLVQVAGRAGRADRPGEVIIQSAFPDHPLLHLLVTRGYAAFAERALAEREEARWPPFSCLALLRASAPRREDAMRFLEQAKPLMRPTPAGVNVLGPVAAAMEKRAGRYRCQLLLQAGDRKRLQQVLAPLRPALEGLPAARGVRWSLDVDPVEIA